MINIKNEVDYMFDPEIDERIKCVCKLAENNYILSKVNNNPPSPSNKNIIISPSNNDSPLNKTCTDSFDFEQEKNTNICSNNIIINTKTPSKNPNSFIIPTFSSNNNNNNYYSTNFSKENSINLNPIQPINSRNMQLNKNKQKIIKPNINTPELNSVEKRQINKKNKSCNKYNNMNNQKNYNSNYLEKDMVDSINGKVLMKSNNIMNKFSFSKENENSDIVNYNSQSLNKNLFNSNLSDIASSFCFECELKQLISDKSQYNKELNKKTKENKEINKIILNGKSLLFKNKLNLAYNILVVPINQGIQHPDLFYLFGELCRRLKMMEKAEKYLISCLDFQNCSPYVYVSLGQLYKEVGQFKFSNTFYKKSLLFFRESFIYCDLGLNYMNLKKFLKSLHYFTEAINLSPKNPQYYNYRCQVYEALGYKDLAKKDKASFNFYSCNKNK